MSEVEVDEVIGEDPEPKPVMIIGHDPFNPKKGAHPAIVPVIEGVRKLQRFRMNVGLYDEAEKVSSLTPEAVQAAADGGFIPESVQKQLPLNAPSIPPPVGQPDPVLAPWRPGQGRPLGAGRKKRGF